MRRLIVVLLLIVVLVGAVAGGGFWWLSRSGFPQRDGEVRVAGLGATATIRYDDWGVPHIEADSAADAAVALGWAHANDRMVQLELGRRRASGRLAEVLGEAALPSDIGFRSLAMPAIADRLLEAAGTESRQLLEAYAHGVNAWLRQRDADLPPELRILRLRPEPWRPVDSLYFQLQMAHELSFWDGRPEESRFELLGAHGLEPALELLGMDDVHVPEGLPELAAARTAGRPVPTDRIAPRAAGRDASPGSNNWAIGGSRTASGVPILANDPHLPLFMPGFWYQVAIRAPDLAVAGMTLPGLPFVVIGQNGDLAWGLTNVMLDDHDLFLEELGADGASVRRGDDWLPLQESRQRIDVAGGEPVELVVRSTDIGVLLEADRETGMPARSLAWTATDALDSAALFLRIARAGSVDELLGELGEYAAPAQNLVVADRHGGLLYAAIGRVPARRAGDGRLPAPAWDPAYGWDGVRPQEDNPVVLNPEEDLLVTANHDIRPFGWMPGPVPFTSYFDTPHRADRIRALLTARDAWTPTMVGDVQVDVTSRWASQLVALLEREYRGDAAAAYELLVGWDGAMTERGPAALFAILERELWDAIFGDQTTTVAFSHQTRRRQLLRVLSGAMVTDWFDDASTPRVESADETVSAALARSWREVVARFGDDPARWDYGALHTLTLAHPLGALPVVGAWWNRGPLPAPGSQTTVAAFGAFWAGDSMTVAYGPSMRWVADPADPDAALAILPTGQSGHPWDDHYGDQLELYRAGRLRETAWSAEKVAASTVSTVRLTPDR